MTESTEWLCRFVAAEGTLAWAHDALKIDFRIRSLGHDRVIVTAELLYFGCYWDNWAEPLAATLQLNGTMHVEAAHSRLTLIEIDPPAPLSSLAIDLGAGLVEWLFTGEPLQLPAFVEPMIAWAETQGIEFYDLPSGMERALGWPQPWNRPKYPPLAMRPRRDQR